MTPSLVSTRWQGTILRINGDVFNVRGQDAAGRWWACVADRGGRVVEPAEWVEVKGPPWSTRGVRG